MRKVSPFGPGVRISNCLCLRIRDDSSITSIVLMCKRITGLPNMCTNGFVSWTIATTVKLVHWSSWQFGMDSIRATILHLPWNLLSSFANARYAWKFIHFFFYSARSQIQILLFLLQMEPVFARSDKFQNFAKTSIGQLIIFILLKLYTFIGMGFCFSPLVLLSFSRWWALHRSLWFYGYLLWLPWPLYKPLLKQLLGTKRAEPKPKSQ